MKNKKSWISSTGILLAFCLAVGIFLQMKTGYFFRIRNMVSILEANSFRLLLALGMTFVIASGGIDLSVGSIISLSSIVMAMLMHRGVPVAVSVMAGIFTGMLLGFVNGAVIHITRINALIVTLATSFMYRGLSLIVTLGSPITKMPQAFRTLGSGDVFGMEIGVTEAVLVLLICFPAMYVTKWGHYLTALGSNAEGLKRCGVKTGFYRIGCFVLMGALAAMAGVIITARLNSAEPNAGLNMEMDAITAVIMGGTPLSGGSASVAGTAIAVILLGIIRNGLTLMSVSSYYQQFITGGILLLAVIIAEIRERKARKYM